MKSLPDDARLLILDRKSVLSLGGLLLRMNVLTDLEIAVARLPDVLSGAMLAGIQEPGVTIGAWAYETDLAMCPIAAAVRYAEKAGDTDTDWDPAWGTRDEYRLRVLDFVEAFDACARTGRA